MTARELVHWNFLPGVTISGLRGLLWLLYKERPASLELLRYEVARCLENYIVRSNSGPDKVNVSVVIRCDDANNPPSIVARDDLVVDLWFDFKDFLHQRYFYVSISAKGRVYMTAESRDFIIWQKSRARM